MQDSPALTSARRLQGRHCRHPFRLSPTAMEPATPDGSCAYFYSSIGQPHEIADQSQELPVTSECVPL